MRVDWAKLLVELFVATVVGVGIFLMAEGHRYSPVAVPVQQARPLAPTPSVGIGVMPPKVIVSPTVAPPSPTIRHTRPIPKHVSKPLDIRAPSMRAPVKVQKKIKCSSIPAIVGKLDRDLIIAGAKMRGLTDAQIQQVLACIHK